MTTPLMSTPSLNFPRRLNICHHFYTCTTYILDRLTDLNNNFFSTRNNSLKAGGQNDTTLATAPYQIFVEPEVSEHDVRIILPVSCM